MTTVQYRNFTNDIIAYNAPVINKSGGKSINLYNKTCKKALCLTTPLMLTWGVSDYEGNERFEMSLQFPTEEYRDDKTNKFLEVMNDFETKIKEDALKNSKEWFGKQHKNMEVIDALWTPMLKYSKNKETGEPDKTKAPTLRVKLPCYDGVWKPVIFDTNHDKIFPTGDVTLTPMDFIHKGDTIACVIQCGGIWHANGKFGVTWRLLQAVTQPRVDTTSVCQIELDESDRDRLQNTASSKKGDGDDVEVESDDEVVVDEDDDEDEPEEESAPEPEPEPQPEPVKKKKVVRKKAA